jgi:hypothetical protein
MKRARLALAAAALAVISAGAGVAVTASGAGAGIAPQGYAQIAQRALQKAGGPFGYRVRCTGIYSNHYLATVRVTCTMTERP